MLINPPFQVKNLSSFPTTPLPFHNLIANLPQRFMLQHKHPKKYHQNFQIPIKSKSTPISFLLKPSISKPKLKNQSLIRQFTLIYQVHSN